MKKSRNETSQESGCAGVMEKLPIGSVRRVRPCMEFILF
jgi:hypothetical protein